MGYILHSRLCGSAFRSGFPCAVTASLGLEGTCVQLVELPMDSGQGWSQQDPDKRISCFPPAPISFPS